MGVVVIPVSPGVIDAECVADYCVAFQTLNEEVAIHRDAVAICLATWSSGNGFFAVHVFAAQKPAFTEKASQVWRQSLVG